MPIKHEPVIRKHGANGQLKTCNSFDVYVKWSKEKIQLTNLSKNVKKLNKENFKHLSNTYPLESNNMVDKDVC